MLDIRASFIAGVVCAVLGALASWYITSAFADLDMANFKLELYEAKAARQAAADKLEEARDKIEELETAKIDASEQKQQTGVRTVIKEVIKYVESPDTGRCALPTSWVQLYNQSLGLGVPGAEPAR